MKRLILSLIYAVLLLGLVRAHPAASLVMDSKGNVYYSDLVHVWRIAPDGSHSIAVRDVHTHELFIDEQDNLYGENEWYEGEATDRWRNYVWCLSNSGVLEQVIPPADELILNKTLIRDNIGRSYWSEKSGGHEVLMAQTPNGNAKRHTEHHFRDIRWLYFSPHDQSLYVVDYLQVKKVTLQGEVSVIANNLREPGPAHAGVGDHHYVYGLWTDAQRNRYVALYGAQKVLKIDPDGTVETVFQAPEGWSPAGGLAAPDGNLWVMEFSERNKTRVRKISANGKHTLFEG